MSGGPLGNCDNSENISSNPAGKILNIALAFSSPTTLQECGTPLGKKLNRQLAKQ